MSQGLDVIRALRGVKGEQEKALELVELESDRILSAMMRKSAALDHAVRNTIKVFDLDLMGHMNEALRARSSNYDVIALVKENDVRQARLDERVAELGGLDEIDQNIETLNLELQCQNNNLDYLYLKSARDQKAIGRLKQALAVLDRFAERYGRVINNSTAGNYDGFSLFMADPVKKAGSLALKHYRDAGGNPLRIDESRALCRSEASRNALFSEHEAFLIVKRDHASSALEKRYADRDVIEKLQKDVASPEEIHEKLCAVMSILFAHEKSSDYLMQTLPITVTAPLLKHAVPLRALRDFSSNCSELRGHVEGFITRLDSHILQVIALNKSNNGVEMVIDLDGVRKASEQTLSAVDLLIRHSKELDQKVHDYKGPFFPGSDVKVPLQLNARFAFNKMMAALPDIAVFDADLPLGKPPGLSMGG